MDICKFWLRPRSTVYPRYNGRASGFEKVKFPYSKITGQPILCTYSGGQVGLPRKVYHCYTEKKKQFGYKKKIDNRDTGLKRSKSLVGVTFCFVSTRILLSSRVVKCFLHPIRDSTYCTKPLIRPKTRPRPANLRLRLLSVPRNSGYRRSV